MGGSDAVREHEGEAARSCLVDDHSPRLPSESNAKSRLRRTPRRSAPMGDHRRRLDGHRRYARAARAFSRARHPREGGTRADRRLRRRARVCRAPSPVQGERHRGRRHRQARARIRLGVRRDGRRAGRPARRTRRHRSCLRTCRSGRGWHHARASSHGRAIRGKHRRGTTDDVRNDRTLHGPPPAGAGALVVALDEQDIRDAMQTAPYDRGLGCDVLHPETTTTSGRARVSACQTPGVTG